MNDSVGEDSETSSLIEGFDPFFEEWVVANKRKRNKKDKKAGALPSSKSVPKVTGNVICNGSEGKPCGKSVSNDVFGSIRCQICMTWYHPACQGLEEEAYKAITRFGLLWLCEECEDHVQDFRNLVQGKVSIEKKMDAQFSSVESQMKEMHQAILENTAILKQQEKAAGDRMKLIEGCISEKKSLESTYAEIVRGSCSEVISEVSTKLSALPLSATPPNDVPSIAKVVDDFFDKDKRKKNIILHNLPEPRAGTLEQRSQEDINQFLEMVKETFRLRVSVAKSFRVGKANPDKPRLLVVTLENEDVKHELLKMAPQLRHSVRWGNIYLSPDQTKVEREASRKLRDELRSRRAAGEQSLVIRNGRIVSNDRPVSHAQAGRRFDSVRNSARSLPVVRSSAATHDLVPADASARNDTSRVLSLDVPVSDGCPPEPQQA